jgi:hypothetical protein
MSRFGETAFGRFSFCAEDGPRRPQETPQSCIPDKTGCDKGGGECNMSENKRLTYRKNGSAGFVRIPESGLMPADRSALSEAAEKLADYEDTGFSPCEIKSFLERLADDLR